VAAPDFKSEGAGFQTRVNASMYKLRALALVYSFTARFQPVYPLGYDFHAESSRFRFLLGTLLAVWKNNGWFDPIQLRVRPRHLIGVLRGHDKPLPVPLFHHHGEQAKARFAQG
jgi:hypothetical protein